MLYCTVLYCVQVVVLDTTAPGSGEMKALKGLLQRRKQQLIEVRTGLQHTGH